ncbi:MAG: GNAT superfamily N-acetyltransferase [Planctomycetota bacterium]|jgi:GNAT superfamily N-acetyltransferase
MTQVTTYYLEMKSLSQLKESSESKGLNVDEVQVKQYQVNKFLYQFVGESWGWLDKLSWTNEQWEEYSGKDNLRTWLASYKGSPAGYYELEQSDDGSTEIAYFGLTPNFIGKGFGGFLLSEAIKSAWAWDDTKRVWVHTCTLDHPSAMVNYQSRGMEIYHEETHDR